MFARRRILLSLLAAGCAAAAPSFAQTDKTLRLGAISAGAPMTADSPLGKILIGALADLGYALGRNLTFETRGAMADVAKLPGLIEELRARGRGSWSLSVIRAPPPPKPQAFRPSSSRAPAIPSRPASSTAGLIPAASSPAFRTSPRR